MLYEVWKDIYGYEGRYQVSNLGRVKSLSRKAGTTILKEKILSNNRLSLDGYVRIALRDGEKPTEIRLHQLVARAFIPNPDNLETVNHIDGDKTNNRVDNLEWTTRSQNVWHSYLMGLKPYMRGTDNTQSKLTEDDVREIRKIYVRNSKEFGTVALSRKYGVSNRVIGLVTRGLSYRNVK